MLSIFEYQLLLLLEKIEGADAATAELRRMALYRAVERGHKYVVSLRFEMEG
jgi:hypothetical protein